MICILGLKAILISTLNDKYEFEGSIEVVWIWVDNFVLFLNGKKLLQRHYKHLFTCNMPCLRC